MNKKKLLLGIVFAIMLAITIKGATAGEIIWEDKDLAESGYNWIDAALVVGQSLSVGGWSVLEGTATYEAVTGFNGSWGMKLVAVETSVNSPAISNANFSQFSMEDHNNGGTWYRFNGVDYFKGDGTTAGGFTADNDCFTNTGSLKNFTYNCTSGSCKIYDRNSGVLCAHSGYTEVTIIQIHTNGAETYFDDIKIGNLSGTMPSPPVYKGKAINISTIFLPENLTQSINTVYFNVTFNTTMATTCVVMLNGTANETASVAFAGKDITLNFTTIIPDSNQNFSFSCFNTSDINDDITNTSNHSIYIDTTMPTLTTTFKNLFVYSASSENVSGQFNISDNFMIHSFNLSLDGTEIFSVGDLTDTLYVYNFSQSPANLSVGNHTLSVRFADGHTASELREDYDLRNGLFNDYLKFNFPEGGYAQIIAKEDSWFDEWKAIREKDRYKFDFQPATPSATQNFVVTSDSPIIIKEKAGYYNDRWLIMGNHWMDFVVDNEPNAKVSFKRIDDFNIDVTIDGLKNPERQIYSSIGDLNVVTQNYTFFITNATNTYSSAVQIYEGQTITLNINTSALILQTDASLNWNGSIRNSTKTSYSNYDSYVATFVTPNVINTLTENITFFWNYTINGTVNNFSGSVKENQTLYRIGIDNCSTYTMRAINITVRRDDTDALQATDIGAYFEVWINDAQNFSSFNLTWNDKSECGVCIYPNISTYHIYSQFEYGGGTDFAIKTHYLTNYTLSNDTQLLDLYLTPNSTAVTFTVTDQDDNVIPDVYISVLRYDFDTNSHITSEIIQTDESGEAIGQIVLTTQWYKFLLVYEGEIVLETDPVKITTTTRNFRINLLTNFFDFFETFDNVYTSLTFTNATLNFAYTFINTEGTSVQACLDVIERSAINDIPINKTCVTSSGGTILVNTGADVAGKMFLATGTVQINPVQVTDLLSVDFDDGYKIWGKDGIFVTFFVRMSLATIGIWNPMVAILLLVLADIGMIFMGLYHMGWTTLIFYIVLAGITFYKLNRK